MNLYNIFEGLTKSDDSIGYKKYFKNPEQPEQPPMQKRYRGWDEYEHELNQKAQPQDDGQEEITEHLPYEIDEAAMRPSAFKQAISQGAEKGVLVGFEFETLIPAQSVKTWKLGPQPQSPGGYDANSTAWIDGKTTNDLIDGITRVSDGNVGFLSTVLDDLFKYKTSIKTQVGFGSVWSHYKSWADNKISEEFAGKSTQIIMKKLKELLNDEGMANTPVEFMNPNLERHYGTEYTGRTFALHVLKQETGLDFSTKIPKSEITPEIVGKIRNAMSQAYRYTRGPIDTKYSEVANAVDQAKTQVINTYYRDRYSGDSDTDKIKQHFAEFCTETMGTDNLKDLLKTKWAFKGRVNNTTDILKQKLWYYVTPGAEEPEIMRPRRRQSGGSYMDGAEFLKANLKDVFGDNMVIFRGYHQDTKKLDRWYIEPDGSLQPNSGDYAAEIVSPPLKADEAMRALNTFYSKAAELKLYTNRSTGLHINVSIPEKLDVLKLAVYVGDNHVLKQFGREENRYARSVIRSLQGKSSLPTIGTTEFKDAEEELKRLVRDISGDHFATVNFNGKYVSFRHAGGDYLNKAGEIANTVGRFVRAMLIASDPSAFRDEYVGKLVKIMKSPAQADSSKMSLSDIRGIAAKGVPVVTVDMIMRKNHNTSTSQPAALKWAKEELGSTNISLVPDPSARERLKADRGFGSETREWIETAPDDVFFRLTVYPSTRRNFETMSEQFARRGTDRGAAFGMYEPGSGSRVAAGVEQTSVIKSNDPAYLQVVKALRGGAAKPLPLPGTKAAPITQPTQQEPEQPQNEPASSGGNAWTLNNARDTQHYVGDLSREQIQHHARRMYAQTGLPVTISLDGVEQGRFPNEEPEQSDANARDTWTLNNGNMAQHYAPSQVNSQRAYELASYMFQQYGRPVIISRDGVEYGRWPREEQREAYVVTDSMGRIHGYTHETEEEAIEAARELANHRGEPCFVETLDGDRVGGARPGDEVDEDFNGLIMGVQEDNDLAGALANGNGVAAVQGTDNNLSPIGSGTNEARIFHSDQKVNVIFNPHRSNKRIIVAKAVDHMLAKRVIDTYVHKSETDPRKQPLSVEDFILQPVGHYTREDQYGGGFGGGSIAPVTDTTSPIHGYGESRGDYKPPKEADYGDEYQDMVKRVAAQEKRKREQRQQQQQKKVDEEMMESHLYALKRAGYDIL